MTDQPSKSVDRLLKRFQAERDSRPNPLAPKAQPKAFEPEPRKPDESIVDAFVRQRRERIEHQPNPLRDNPSPKYMPGRYDVDNTNV